jgi:hypothetical protein
MDSLDFYRRNLKPIMAALTLMAMITFVFDDSMRAGNTTLVPIILAFLFGGGGFVWGTRKGKQNEYGMMGAVLGAVLGLVVIAFGGRDPNEQATIAGLTQREIANLKNRREIANRILAEIYKKSHPIPKQFLDAGPIGQQFYQMQLQRALEQIQFTFGNDDFEKDVVFGELLRREAKRLGIVVNDDAVSNFIKSVSDQNLSTEDFREVKQALHQGDHFIYEILREEIAARMAAEMTYPRAVSTPLQRWMDFRKVNVKHAIQATTIPVEPFAKDIPDPSDSQLMAFFNEHAEKVPGPRGEIGFRQPARARIAYLEADYETIEKQVTPPTDEEVAKYYEDNKEFFIDRTPAPSDNKDEASTDNEPKKDAADDAKKSEENEEKKDNQKSETKKPEPPAKDDASKTEKKDDEKPAEPKASKDEAADPKKTDKEKSESKPSDDAKLSDSKSDTDQGSECEDDAAADEAEQSEKSAEPKAKGPKDDSQPEAKKSDEKKPDAETTKEAPKTDGASDDKKPEEKPAKEPSDSKDEKPKSEDDKPKTPAEKPEEKSEKPPELKYKPFDEVKEKIFDDLLRARTLDEMKKRIESAVGKMRRLGSYTIADKKSKSYRSPEQVASELRDFAKSSELTYVETPWLSALELSQAEDLKISRAVDALEGGMSRQGAATVIQRVFGRGNDGTYTPEIAEDPGTKNRFAYWVIERREAHVPKFDEEGVRQQVTRAWKLKQALPKAEERANAIAKRVSAEMKLVDAIAGETVTGDKDGLQLTVVDPQTKFSHFTLQGASAPNVAPFSPVNQRIERTTIPGLEKLGDEFFTSLSKLKVGECAAIPNLDKSAFIVVQVTDREEVSTEEGSPQRAEFLKSWPFSPPASDLANLSFDPLRREWVQSIERRYNVKWPVK